MEEEARIARALRAEHRLLRRRMARMADWIASGVPSSALRERARMLFEALDDHARFEEEALFVPMRRRWPAARRASGREATGSGAGGGPPPRSGLLRRLPLHLSEQSAMKRWIILLMLGGLLGFGCGAPPPPSGTPSTAGPVVRMPKSYRFDPPTLRVKVGTTVTWINEDHFTHNVHFLSGADWRSPPLRPGEQASYTFA